MENTNEIRLFHIPEHRMEEFLGKLELLNKKATKVSAPHITYKIVNTYDRSYTEHPITGKMLLEPMIIRFNAIEIIGLEPKFAGWTFLARIDHEDGFNVINAIPGIELDNRYRTTGAICEHCKVSRFRKVSYVVRHEDGTEKQVGSTCLKDFLGHGSPEKIGYFCEGLFLFVHSISEDDFLYGGHIEPRNFTVALLALANRVIAKYGWTSATKAREIGIGSTADDVRRYLYDRIGREEMKKDMGEPSEDDRTYAVNALEWLKTQKPDTDYMHNLINVCSAESVHDKHLGIAVSLIPAYKRAVEHELLKKAAGTTLPSSWIGHPDLGRIALKAVKVITANEYHEGGFGRDYYLNRFVANGKDKLTWFASSEQEYKTGDVIDITFTVKKLETYKGEEQTTITRVKLGVKGPVWGTDKGMEKLGC